LSLGTGLGGSGGPNNPPSTPNIKKMEILNIFAEKDVVDNCILAMMSTSDKNLENHENEEIIFSTST
jgi:hypothetical protein